MSKKTKVITSNIQPNPKEAEIWAKVNEDGSREVKQYNSSTGKFECCGGSDSGSGSGSEDNLVYYKVPQGGIDLPGDLVTALYLKEKSSFEGASTIRIGTVFDILGFGDYKMEDVIAIAFSKNPIIKAKIQMGDTSISINNYEEYKNFYAQNGMDFIPIYERNSWEQITKDQFYNLEA